MTAPRTAGRDRHLPVQRHRGLDAPRAARRAPGRYAELRERHRALLRAAFEAHGGDEQGTEGDSFFVVFRERPEAVAAAVDGAAGPRRGAVAGRTPRSASGWACTRARSRSAGGRPRRARHQPGGADRGRRPRRPDRCLSDATRALVAERAARRASAFATSGSTGCKDLRAPERLAQVVIDGLPADFPTLRSLDARPNNLPTQLTTFVGRDDELAEAAALLETTRLLTLTGPGGTGKTRLSLQLAATRRRTTSPTASASCRSSRSATRCSSRRPIAAAVGVADSRAASRSPRPSTTGSASRRVLLVLDNFEQVVAAGPVVADLLRRCPGTRRLIATSRVALQVSGEQEYPVPGLPAPPDPSQPVRTSSGCTCRAASASSTCDALSQYEAVRLFIERAVAGPARRSPSRTRTPRRWPAIAARLHGMPLAIELAAARIKLLSPDQILARLEHQLDVLLRGRSRDLPERQQTLRGAIAWSYDLLDDGSTAPARPAVGVRRAAASSRSAEAVCGPAAELGRRRGRRPLALADQSLVRVDESADGEPRFGMLETIREYAAEMLEARGEARGDRSPAIATGSGAGRARGARSCPAPTSGAGSTGSSSSTTTSAPSSTGRSPSRTRRSRSGSRSRCGGSGRSAATSTRRAAPRGDGGPAVVARRRATSGTLRSRRSAGVCWWQGDLQTMRQCYEEALGIWQGIGDEGEIANAYYNASFSYAIGHGRRRSGPAIPRARARRTSRRPSRLYREIGDQRGEAQRPVGPGHLLLLHAMREEAARTVPRRRWTLLRRRRATGRWRAGRCTCWLRLDPARA